MISGRWLVTGLRWPEVSDRWLVTGGLWPVVSDQWLVTGGLWPVVCGRWSVSGVWSLFTFHLSLFTLFHTLRLPLYSPPFTTGHRPPITDHHISPFSPFTFHFSPYSTPFTTDHRSPIASYQTPLPPYSSSLSRCLAIRASIS